MNITVKTQGNNITATSGGSKLFSEPMLKSDDKLYESDEMFEFILTEKQAFTPEVDELINEGLIKVTNEDGVFYAAIDSENMSKLRSFRPSNTDVETRAETAKPPKKAPKREQGKPYKSLAQRKNDILGLWTLGQNLANTLINGRSLIDYDADGLQQIDERLEVAIKAAELYVDKKCNYSQLDKIREFTVEHSEFYETVLIKCRSYKESVMGVNFRLDKLSFDGRIVSRDLIRSARRLSDTAELIRFKCGSNPITSRLVEKGWNIIDVLDLPLVDNFTTEKAFRQHLGLENAVNLAESLHDIREEYADIVMRMPRMVNGQLVGRYQHTDGKVVRILERSAELYEKYELDMKVQVGHDPKDYHDIEIDPVVNDRVLKMI